MKRLFLISMAGLFFACNQPLQTQAPSSANTENGWQRQLDSMLPLLGHRNWIIVVDKAFPAQTAAGMEVINTNENLLPVLKYTLQQINASTHVSPIIYEDKELSFLTENEAPGIDTYKASLAGLLAGRPAAAILHDSVFTKMDAASRLFKVLVLKTNATIPYSSVYFQLDCKYWNPEKEKQLRDSMKADAAFGLKK